MIVTTLRCNHKCRYCHAAVAPMEATQFDMTEETAKKVVDTIFYNLFLTHLCYHQIEIYLQPSQTINNYSIENNLSLHQRTYHQPEIERANTNSFLISSDDVASLNIATTTDDSDLTDSDNYIISSTDSDDESDDEIIIITTNNNILHE